MVSEELRALRLDKQIPAKDIVAVVQEFYPKFDKTMLSKCERGDKYGTVLNRDMVDELYKRFAPDEIPAIKKKRDGDHRLTRRISCRLEDDDYEALQKHVQADGYETMQDWLTGIVRQYNEFHSQRN